jgi:hypothetical protein
MGIKRIKLLSLLLVAVLFVQNADAVLTYLPYSSHYQGTSYFNYSDTGVKGRVEFAVYDTLGPYGNEWTGATGFDAPGDGRYIYAYQIFNDDDSALIEGFTMWANDYHVLDIIGMGAQDPQEGDYIFGLDFVEPTDMGTNNGGVQAWWEFGNGLFIAGEDSWFLIFSSNNNWTAGSYWIGPISNVLPVPNPEPCTLALLSLGSAILFAKRKNSVVKTAHTIKSHRVRSY